MLSRQEEHLRDAKLYKENSLVIGRSLENLDIKKGINWNYKHSKSSKTYQVYLHSMSIIRSLVIASKHFKDDSFLEDARQLILLWDSKTHNSAISEAWHEHAVSSRLSNVIHFQERANDFKLDDETYQKLLLKHCEFLSLKKNYKENNHGIMMDNSLIIAAQRLTDKNLKQRYLDTAYYRVKMAYFRDFSKMGVHLENSPEYHKMVLNLIKKVSENLDKNGYSLGKDFRSFLTRANQYSKAIIKPDKKLPIIGDSSLYIEKIDKNYYDFVDQEAGIFISQYRNKNNEKNSTWLSFKSGYRRKTHKHKDDLSIWYYLNGHDLLVDSGKYSYNLDDPIRAYIVSPKAHSTIYLKDSDYRMTNEYTDQLKLKTTRFLSRGNYKTSSGINNLYPNTFISRNVIVTKDNLLIVSDIITSTEEQEAVQNFVLPETASVHRINESQFEVTVDEKVYVFQNHIVDDEKNYGTIEKGYLSYRFNNYVENQRIEFSKKGKKIRHLTTIHEKSQDLIIDNVKVQRLKINLDTNGSSNEYLL